MRRKRGEGYLSKEGYWRIRVGGKQVYEHISKAEIALGKKLPAGAVVHHMDEDSSNNKNANLVICPDKAYHKLLHTRTDALNATGHADWLRCKYCGVYSPPDQVRVDKAMSKYHPACDNAASRAYTIRKKLNERKRYGKV